MKPRKPFIGIFDLRVKVGIRNTLGSFIEKKEKEEEE
jgi:hypothetical protein